MATSSFSSALRNIFYILLIITIAPPIIQQVWVSFTRVTETRTKVAWVEIDGIMDDAGPYVRQIKHHFKDQEVKAILLRIESPGSLSGTAEVLFSEILQLKKDYPKPIITLVENTCTSGAYWTACATDHIITAAVAKIGSIGVVIRAFTVKDLMDQYKIHYTPIAAGTYKTAGDPFTDLTPQQKEMLQTLAQQTYEQFTAAVAARRGKVSLKDVNVWADGKIFIGAQALKLGLVDEIGTISTAETWLRKNAPIEGSIEWVKEAGPSFWEQFMGKAQGYYAPDAAMPDAFFGKMATAVMARMSINGFTLIS